MMGLLYLCVHGIDDISSSCSLCMVAMLSLFLLSCQNEALQIMHSALQANM